MRSRLAAPLLALALGTLYGGCTVSQKGALAMREEKEPKSIEKNQEELLEFLHEKVGAASHRATVMETAAIVARRDDHRTRLPELYSRLVDALKAELANPRVDPRSENPSEDGVYLRAFSLFCLGKLEDPNLLDTFLGAMTDGGGGAAAPVKVQVAALNALVPQLEAVKKSAPFRNRLLSAMPILRAQDASDGDRDRLLGFFVAELKDLGTVTNVLDVALKEERATGPFLEALKWDYEVLHHDVQARRPGVTAEQYAEDVAVLLRIARCGNASAKRAARAILLEVAPGSLFRDMTRLAPASLALDTGLGAGAPSTGADDLEALAVLLPRMRRSSEKYASVNASEVYFTLLEEPTLNEVDVLAPKAWKELEGQATGAMLAYTDRVDAPRREFLYSALFEYDPDLFAHHLVARQARTLAEGEPEVKQQVRYLGNLIVAKKLANTPGREGAVKSSLASLVAFDSAKVREQIASYLLERETERLATACVPVLRTLEKQSAPGAKALLVLYVECLRRLELAGGRAAYASDTWKKLDDAPYAVLAHAFARPSPSFWDLTVHFLEGRDLHLLSRVVSTWVAQSPKVERYPVVILGDLVRTKRDLLDPGDLAAAIDVLAGAAERSADEEPALLCVRYLAEAKHEHALAALDAYQKSKKCAWPSVQTVLGAALAKRVVADKK